MITGSGEEIVVRVLPVRKGLPVGPLAQVVNGPGLQGIGTRQSAPQSTGRPVPKTGETPVNGG